MNRIEVNAITPPEPAEPDKKESSPCVTNEQLSFAEFSSQPEYIKANRELVETLVLNLPDNFFHVDIATGTGLIPLLIIEEATKQNKTGRIIGIDPNVTSLNIAKNRILKTDEITDEIKVKFKVEFIEGMGQNLKQLLDGKIPKEGVNSVSILDALHEIKNDEDKRMIIKSMAEILKPGGLFVFNSAFTTQGITKDPMSWAKWKLSAMAILGRKRNKQAATMPIHSPETYKKMIGDAGLEIDPDYERTKIVMLTETSLEAISKYPAFSNGSLEDVQEQESIPIVEKCSAMIRALRSLNITALPRVWYEIIARKPL